MQSRKKAHLSLSAVLLLCTSLAIPVPAQEQTAPVKIGMVQTLFTDIPSPLVQVILQPFGTIIKDFTGVDGRVVLGGDALSLGKDLNEGKVDLAIYHGVEFAWAQQKYPKLRPLMCALTKYKHVHAHMVVRKEMPSTSVADLKGKTVSLPLKSREHCRLFLQRGCSECGGANPQSFYSQVVSSINPETALDDLVLGKVDAVVLDTVAYEMYQDIKPGCHARLKVLKTSEVFPTGVIAYRDGGLSDSILTRFREGLGSANKTERGRDMMSMFRITSFENIPEDYTQTLSEILKAYPAPESATPVSAQR